MTAMDLLRSGGRWLGAVRNWLQWHKRNGSDVTWGSQDVIQPPMTVRDIEEAAAHAVEAAIHEERERCAKIAEERGCETTHNCAQRIAKMIRASEE